MTELDYYFWCLTYVSKIHLFESVYNRPQVVSEEVSPTTLESLFGFIMNLFFLKND